MSHGRGVSSTASYPIDTLHGELVGELVAPGFHNDGWAADVARDDLEGIDDEDILVCQVYPRYSPWNFLGRQG